MVAQLSLLTQSLAAASSSSFFSSSTTSLVSVSGIASAAATTLPSTISSITTSPGSIGTIYASSASNGTSTSITAKPQTTLSLFNACSGDSTTCQSLNDLTYFGSVISAAKSSTIYALGCSQNGKNATAECFDTAITVTQGPSMFARVDDSGAVPTTVSCAIDGKASSASCVESYMAAATGTAAPAGTITASAAFATNSANSTATSTSKLTFEFDGDQIYYNKLVVTAGAAKLDASNSSTMATNTPSSPSIASPSTTHTSNAARPMTLSSVAGIAAALFAVLAY